MSSCEWINDLFDANDYVYIDEDCFLGYQVGDILIYSTIDRIMIDTFEVFYFEDRWNGEDTHEPQTLNQQHLYWLRPKTQSQNKLNFDINVFPNSLLIFYWKETRSFLGWEFAFSFDNPTNDTILRDKSYTGLYIFENEHAGNSDTLINTLLYHRNEGIVGYKYGNGDEYLLDTIYNLRF